MAVLGLMCCRILNSKNNITGNIKFNFFLLEVCMAPKIKSMQKSFYLVVNGTFLAESFGFEKCRI